MDTVDAHLHLFKALSDEYPRAIFEGMTPPDRDEPAEVLLGAMDNAGVDRAVIVALSKEDRYLGEVLDQSPGKFVGVADPNDDAEAMAVFPLLRAMSELEVKGWFYGPPDQLMALDKCLQVLPDLKVVLNHLAFLPDMEAELRIDEHGRPRFKIDLPPKGLELVETVAGKHPSLHVLFSGHYAFSGGEYPYEDLTEVARRIYGAFGASRMMMASDWPWIRDKPGYEETLALVDHLLPGIPPDERDMIRGGTAMALFDF